jgi:hypothetical protein
VECGRGKAAEARSVAFRNNSRRLCRIPTWKAGQWERPILSEQRLALEDGRTLGFAEFGHPNGDPVLEFHGCPGRSLEAWNYDEAGKKLAVRAIGIDSPGLAYRRT